MNYQYAIFDMDGTLTDSMGVWNRLSVEYLAAHGVADPDWKLLEQTIPMTMLETAAFLVRTFDLPRTPAQVVSEINALMEAHYRTDIPLKPGAASCLDRLQRAGFQMAVASSTSPHLLDICLRRLGVRDRFAFLLSCEEVGVGKERPDVYLEAARRLGGTPEQTIVFEDCLFAARTAKAAGFAVAAVWDRESQGDQEALSALADWYLPQLDNEAFFAGLR